VFSSPFKVCRASHALLFLKQHCAQQEQQQQQQPPPPGGSATPPTAGMAVHFLRFLKPTPKSGNDDTVVLDTRGVGNVVSV